MKRRLNKILMKINRRLKIVWEKLIGFDFSENHSIEELGLNIDQSNMYSASPNFDLELALRELNIQSTDSILDYGAGKGSAMVAMSKFNFNLIHGVELSDSICEIGRKNLKKLKLKNTSIFLSDATEFKDLDIYTFFYFFNPFPGNILEIVLQNIKESYRRKPRTITLIYYLPAFRRVIDRDPFFHNSKSYKGKYYELLLYTSKKI